MSGVRVLVGTRKGAFVLTCGRQAEDVGRQRSALRRVGDLPPEGIAGRSQSHLRVAVIRLVRSGDAAIERRRQDVGAGRQQVRLRGTTGTHQWYDGTPHPWEFKRVWHVEPSLTDPDTVFAGVEDAAIFRTTDGGQSWQELPGLRTHSTGNRWQPGAGGMCLHTILLDPSNANRMFIAISAAGRVPDRRWRARRGGRSTRACSSQYIPDPAAEVGHCVHRIAMHRSRPDVLYMQKHWDVLRSTNAGDSWEEVSGNLPTRLRLRHRRQHAKSPRRSTSCRSRATPSTIRPRASCACIAAAPAATNGSR